MRDQTMGSDTKVNGILPDDSRDLVTSSGAVRASGRRAAATGTPASPVGEAVAPITAGRIEMCLQSSTYWAQRLPQFADRMQRRADAFAISAALLSALTGLAVWAALSSTEDWWGQAAVSFVAMAAAAIGIVPKVKNYGETAGKARELSSQYGSIKGRLADALEWARAGGYDDGFLRQLVNDFEAAKRSKDSLSPYPKEEQDGRNAERKLIGSAEGKP
ncbi:hypothetical protein [Nucisporomicrobium flavum]|uniref:hypothetical protein n=1 Tax=Nucisporomicrobium flavum TaxID=2785915 RepID=UPI0018F38A9D|nr:hypothetical protein [Nucisporomicrobium flavum]